MGNTQKQQIESYNGLPTSKNKLLVHGYIRKMDTKLQNSIIPKEVVSVCCCYCYSTHILCYLCEESAMNNFKFQFHARYDDKSYAYKPNISRKDTIIIQDAAMCLVRNIKLSAQLLSNMNSSSTKTRYDVIFKCGGNTRNKTICKESNALIWNPHSFQNNTSKLNVFNIKLPDIPNESTDFKSLVFSDKLNALFLIGQGLYELDIYNWKWSKLKVNYKKDGIDMVSDYHVINATSSCILQINGKEKLFSMEYGKGCIVDLYEMRNVQYIKQQISERCRNGICYDKLSKNIYIGGGMDNETSIIYFNTDKNKWYELPNYTNMIHNYFPALWKDGDILFIGSARGNGIEWIDLRDNKNNQWNVITYSLATYFDTHIYHYTHRCRLLTA